MKCLKREHVEKLLVTSENIIINDLVDNVFERKTQKISALLNSVLQTIGSPQILVIINNHLIRLLELLNEKSYGNLSNKEIIEKQNLQYFLRGTHHS